MHKNVRLPIAYHVIGHPVLSRAENVHGVWLLLLDFFLSLLCSLNIVFLA